MNQLDHEVWLARVASMLMTDGVQLTYEAGARDATTEVDTHRVWEPDGSRRLIIEVPADDGTPGNYLK